MASLSEDTDLTKYVKQNLYPLFLAFAVAQPYRRCASSPMRLSKILRRSHGYFNMDSPVSNGKSSGHMKITTIGAIFLLQRPQWRCCGTLPLVLRHNHFKMPTHARASSTHPSLTAKYVCRFCVDTHMRRYLLG